MLFAFFVATFSLMGLPGQWITLCLAMVAAVGHAQPVGPLLVPSPRQLAWHSLEYSAFVHFGINTFTNREWGYGDESPALFNPVEFDADRIVRIFRDAGMRSVILTAKHHDGFCLWPSAFTEHSVKNSLWKQGRGDVVKEFSEACRRYGLRFGIYLSPWDRNHRDYGRPEYLVYYRAQLRELLTQYGEISEVWFDGANGGDGFYGGARETRHIDPRTYYDWSTAWALVRKFQPGAVIFSDVGPDIRWVGNEQGYAGETNWSTYTPLGEQGDAPAPGYTRYKEGIEGHRDGTAWIPAECDVSIRPGWFYHPAEDTAVKSGLVLMRLYLRSVGRNAALLLNVPPDRRGLIHTADSSALMEFRRLRDVGFSSDHVRAFQRDTAGGATWTATLIDEVTFNCIVLSEGVSLGQRVASFQVEWWDGTVWRHLTSGTTIGHKRILATPPASAKRIRIVVDDARAPAVIDAIGVFSVPLAVVDILK